jgi:hypothetical protein
VRARRTSQAAAAAAVANGSADAALAAKLSYLEVSEDGGGISEQQSERLLSSLQQQQQQQQQQPGGGAGARPRRRQQRQLSAADQATESGRRELCRLSWPAGTARPCTLLAWALAALPQRPACCTHQLARAAGMPAPPGLYPASISSEQPGSASLV